MTIVTVECDDEHNHDLGALLGKVAGAVMANEAGRGMHQPLASQCRAWRLPIRNPWPPAVQKWLCSANNPYAGQQTRVTGIHLSPSYLGIQVPDLGPYDPMLKRLQRGKT